MLKRMRGPHTEPWGTQLLSLSSIFDTFIYFADAVFATLFDAVGYKKLMNWAQEGFDMGKTKCCCFLDHLQKLCHAGWKAGQQAIAVVLTW